MSCSSVDIYNPDEKIDGIMAWNLEEKIYKWVQFPYHGMIVRAGLRKYVGLYRVTHDIGTTYLTEICMRVVSQIV